MIQSRRTFLKTLGALYGSVLLLPACTSTSASPYRVFTAEEADCLIALCEQVIPADHDPGATDAGVIHFIDKLLFERFPQLLPSYRQGLRALDASCREMFGQPLTSLTVDRQIEVMQAMEANKLPEGHWQEVRASSFFSQVVRHTMMGFYGSPRHGGNRNYVSYRMMKLDFPLVVGQNRYTHG